MQSSKLVKQWIRLDEGETGIYLWPEKPEWFVPNTRGDFILSRLLDGRTREAVAREYGDEFDISEDRALMQVVQMAGRLEKGDAEPYEGRATHLSLEALRECWLHITNRCNARCGHCMFACSPDEGASMEEEAALSVVRQAHELGCELFYFTGGEPLIHPDFESICDYIFRNTEAHVVVLTNAIGIDKFLPRMQEWPRERLHLQVSVDGTEADHDAIRGEGAFRRLTRNIRAIRDAGLHVTLAMAVHNGNYTDMPELIRFAAKQGVSNLHYLWLFTRGKAGQDLFAEPDDIADSLIEAASLAEEKGVLIDNVEILKSQVFSLPGTKFDLTNAGWESLAVGPEGRVFPSPALVGQGKAVCGNARDGLEQVWRQSGKLEELRSCSIASTSSYRANPLRFLVGGGDIDHSLSNGGEFTGYDPYVPLYNRIARWLIAREAFRFPDHDSPGLRLRMGDYMYECGEGRGGVFFTHSNCVLSLPGKDGHALARDFYVRAAEQPNTEIVNPVKYDDEALSFIPEEARVRSYGCGSPVGDADLSAGETVVDLGCGAGIECFIASERVGEPGRVVGVDMLPQMLERAEKAALKVADELGYGNVDFEQGTLEDLPIADSSVDVVVSNCVINLCEHKRQVFQEIYRILKPGGRLVISDIASDTDIPIDIQYNERLRGECLGGAFRQDRLFQLLSDVNFRQATVMRRFPYRKVRAHQFYSLTYSAVKPVDSEVCNVLYRGPFAAAITEDGRIVPRGESVSIPWTNGRVPEGEVFLLDQSGEVKNAAEDMSCGCCAPAEEAEEAACCSPATSVTEEEACCSPRPEVDQEESLGTNVGTAGNGCCSPGTAVEQPSRTDEQKLNVDCMVCGAPLQYLEMERRKKCFYCEQEHVANAVCEEDHFVCDDCHRQDALQVIENICLNSTDTDMIALLKRIRRHHSVPMHGPEHHALVPAIIVTAYRNAGGEVSEERVKAAIHRGATISGGSCAFLGICGAATGVGTGFSIILGSNPLKGRERQLVQKATAQVLDLISGIAAPRCCQRDCWIALQSAAELSRQILPMSLEASGKFECRQLSENKECVGSACPLWPSGERGG